MKKIFTLIGAALFAVSCSSEVEVVVSNETELDRKDEMVELKASAVCEKLGIEKGAPVVVRNAEGVELASQYAVGGKLIFQASVAPSSESTYTITAGTPAPVEPKVFGRQFPERVDDFAWENDCIAFRIYGPALQASGERAYGNDVWVKSTSDLVVEDRYKKELDPEMVQKIKELRKTDAEAAQELQNTISYHVDHGNGMDCYKVGPTLGAGGAALIADKDIAYPYCYEKYEILDNGPLRLTVQFTYTPMTIGKRDDVVETRVITMDAGTHFNKTRIFYTNIEERQIIMAGIVMAGEKGTNFKVSSEMGYAAYEDVDRPEEQGAIYIGTVFEAGCLRAGDMPFMKADPLQQQLGMTGHVALMGEYLPDSNFTYYWGAAWEKYDITSFEDWVSYVEAKSTKVKSPLKVTLK